MFQDDNSNSGLFATQDDLIYCSCPKRRHLLDDDKSGNSETWKIVYTCFVILIMFVFLVTDRFGADSIMLSALTLFMAAEIITVQEGLVGFANQGVMTVLVLFVVAKGISKTGALDWYMGKALGHPKTATAAQLRLMIPVSIASAFLNNTPIVAVMIPIVQKWARNIKIPIQQLLIPLSFATILGGTCTLIGTSTNLVVVGLLNERYTDISIGLFDLGIYGVPVAMAGIAYILIAAPFLLPNSTDDDNKNDRYEDILLGARLTQWSPAVGRSIKRSGLRDTGGIFLVSVHRATTGNIHRAVSNDFVLNVGDILYFTGLVESFGEFCEEHGLEVVTNETTIMSPEQEQQEQPTEQQNDFDLHEYLYSLHPDYLATVEEEYDIGVTKDSLLDADEAEILRGIYRLTEIIRHKRFANMVDCGTTRILVSVDKDLIVIGINTQDRPGLLLDISKALLRFHFQVHHTEAAVVSDRSLSIWRCEVEDVIPDVEDIWSVLNALFSDENGVQAIKQRGLRVIRAKVCKGSRLIGKTADEMNFRTLYKAAIVAVHKDKNPNTTALASIRFQEGDSLVLQAGDDSPLLKRPPFTFYSEHFKDSSTVSRTSPVGNFVRKLTGRTESLDSSGHLHDGDIKDHLYHINNSDSSSDNTLTELESMVVIPLDEGEDPESLLMSPLNNLERFTFNPCDDIHSQASDEKSQVENLCEPVPSHNPAEHEESVWKDLQVLFPKVEDGEDITTREFLTAMAVANHSQLSGKSAMQVGINKLPDIFLVGIDRPFLESDEKVPFHHTDDQSSSASIHKNKQGYQAVAIDEPLKSGDILWFSGPASVVGDLRKIPGLVSYENDEVKKIAGKLFDRRLVQAVISRKSPLVGKTVKEVHFRTRYGAAVIAVHREGKRVHEHPGNVKLHAGDVLLLEAGASFIAKSAKNDRSFALLAEVKDSAPPRLSLLVPALLVAAGMLAVFMADLTSLLISALVASILMVCLGIMSEQEARDAVNWEVYITIASAFGIGSALVNSGVADAVANFLVDVGSGMGIGDAGLFGSVYFATFLMSNVVTNNAAAALLFPIAMNAAERTDTDRVLMSYALMLGASASFMSPLGYTTNLLIYGPGGYRYTDFLKFGTPMQLVLLVLSTVYLSFVDPWWVSWIGSGLVLAIVVISRVGTSSVASIFMRQKETKQTCVRVEN